MVLALLNISGKSNDQIMNDLNQAMGILRAKERLALGGANAARQGQVQTAPVTTSEQQDPNDFSQMSDDELRAIASGVRG